MSDAAAPALAPSQSFSGLASPSLVSKLTKRRLSTSSTLEFFAPAAKSFQPLPYTPNSMYGPPENRPKFMTRQVRSHDALTLPGMDPLPTDPNVVFVHPPFTTFPNSSSYPDGLCYQVLADNPEWFLDCKDFIHQNNTNPQAIPYPPVLEPPRGWCPARKKDLKDRGSDGWPEGEEPRLRCTFCRRTYAGVNAKSMWRRHVFEKHKIAMSNRRDTNDRPRGRGSGKENKQVKPREEPHDKLLNMEVAPQTNEDIVGHKSKFRTAPPEDKPRRDKKQGVIVIPPTSSRLGSSSEEELPLATDSSEAQTPPHSPLAQPSHLPDAQSNDEMCEPPVAPAAPQSPYDPEATPAFRHSPPPLPSDQPWRFPSPSHPLHSQSRDVPLTMFAPANSSPFLKGAFMGASPRSSPFSTPNVSRSSDLKTPSTFGFSAVKSSSRPWFFRNHMGSPLEKHSKANGRYGSSPLSSILRETPAGHKRTISALSDDLFSDSLLNSDPFAVLSSPWNRITSRTSPQKSSRSLGDDSPVLRTGPLPPDPGLGIGLLAPFSLPEEAPTLEDIDAELEEMEKSERRCSGSPPAKKRRLSLRS